MSREVAPGEHIAPCSACDNLHFKALALNTLFCWGAGGDNQRLRGCCCLQSTRDLVAHSLLLQFSLQPQRLWTPALTDKSSASRFHRTPCKTRCIQYSAKQQGGYLCHTQGAQKKTFTPQRLSTEPVNNGDRNRPGCATSILFPFRFLSFTSDLVLS